ncbi:uncharacterized protein EI90DRAFT_3020819 [Cantharellus anzutake]|uniref:uncharacterized protein n=1 Tax=Cantharellus anzutake TaxID=1750568 RepID=UPI0019030E7B|nr:uncharacterized protein EI90DRAFT_3020819 [Cantharellus anzutake]KAF8319245.1 hypothetical protein EI90DRAFT_3020819 [Cantharellus anzutake]
MGLAPSPLWEFFHKLSEFYGNNKTHYAAICKGCIESHITALENEDTEKLMSGAISERRGEVELRAAASELPPKIQGSTARLAQHLTTTFQLAGEASHKFHLTP